MELHCSQTYAAIFDSGDLFETPMELHCSQTCESADKSDSRLRPLWNYTALKLECHGKILAQRFETPMELHCSQTMLPSVSSAERLRPLWNYTALKRQESRRHPKLV